MKSILSELYDGEIRPFEKTLPKDSEYDIESEKYDEEMAKLREEVSKKTFKRIQNAINLYGNIFSMECEESFYTGFELGSTLMIEMYTNRNNVSREWNFKDSSK